jgi:hypothetical protein
MWFDCVTQPPELGKKVLCMNRGDIYVAMRFEDKYLLWPFSEHYLAKDLLYPEIWCEIDFPPGYTGHLKVSLTGDIEDALTLEELKLVDEKSYFDFIESILKSVGSLKRKEI